MKKITRHFLFLVLCMVTIFLMGCSNIHKPDIEEVITGELELLKNLDISTTQKYISYKELFPDAEKTSTVPTEVEEVFSLYFQNFDYKILSLDVEEDTAVANIRLKTIDAQALAKDFAAERLKQYITAAANSQNTNDNLTDDSLEAHYLLLNKILKEKEYETVETTCTMHLVKSDDSWYIQSDRSLENQLVGGFISYLSDSSLLSAQEAAEVYFSTLKSMSQDQFSAYLGLDNALDTADESKKELTQALLQQIYELFDYQIIKSSDDGFTAKVDLELTTLDAEKIMAEYRAKLEDYLATPEAVIDGSEGRTEKSLSLLLEEIKNSDNTTTVATQVELYNDGVFWKLQMDNRLGSALFSNLTDTRPEDTEGISQEEDSGEDWDEEEDFSSEEEEWE